MMFYRGAVLAALFAASVAIDSEVANVTTEGAAGTSETVEVEPEAAKKTYEGYQVVRVTPESEKHLQVLRFIEKSVDSLWTPIPIKLDSETKSHVDIMVNPDQVEQLKYILECSAMPYEVSITDVQGGYPT